MPVGAGSSTDIVHRRSSSSFRPTGTGGDRGKPRRRRRHHWCRSGRPGAAWTDTHEAGARRGAPIAPALYKNLAYHPARDFAAVAPIGISPAVLVVSPAKESRAPRSSSRPPERPNALNFSSVGIGTATHLSVERFQASAGIQAVHIPFKGGAKR